MADDEDRTASLMTPAKLAQVRPRAPVGPAAWLDQMASDAGHQHLARLAELRVDLEAQAGQRNFSPLVADLARVAEALPKLDFGLLQSRGLLARLSGKGKGSGAEFAAQFERIEVALKALGTQALEMQKQQAANAARTDLALLEFEVEFRAVDKVIDQGARWLQDMRNQLKTREAAAADDAARQQVREDAARCEVLVARLKALRAVSSAAQQAHEQARATATRREAAVQSLQQAFTKEMREWQSRLAPIARAAGDGDNPSLGLEGPMECHRDLQLRVKQAAADCGQVQAHEKALAESLQVLGAQLAGTAR